MAALNSSESSGDSLRDEVVLIGPMCAGKTTIGRRLARRLAIPLISLDEIRREYRREIGYDVAHAQRLVEERGIWAKIAYDLPFHCYELERVVADHRDCVLDLGACHTVFDDAALWDRVRRALAPFANVVLLLPSADPDESLRILDERAVPHDDATHRALNEHYVRHHCNYDLATCTVYTDGRSHDAVCDEIIRRVGRDPVDAAVTGENGSV